VTGQLALMGAVLPLVACAQGASTTEAPLRYLALGDSYTIGEGVAPGERWPGQLAEMLRAGGFAMADPDIIARTGWTTGELDRGIDRAVPSGLYDLVSLLIGVNNQFREMSIDEYRAEFAGVLERAIGFAAGDPGRVLVLSIPDWGVTPFATAYDRARVAAEIDLFNAAARHESERRGVTFLDITGISRRAADDTGLLAGDGLHPSGEMYRQWARLALEVAVAALSR
jgi:lysophospholipase L1-like esterase